MVPPVAKYSVPPTRPRGFAHDGRVGGGVRGARGGIYPSSIDSWKWGAVALQAENEVLS